MTSETDLDETHPASIKRAVAFIDANAHTDISLADIVSAANVGPRAVQLGFRRHFGLTPMAYLRRVRLAQVHKELTAADPYGTDSVEAIASRWGFVDLQQFEQTYRSAYGVSPSHTLRMDS
jgi:transcriptional regulator GlxA family with amidase domain